MKSRSAKKQKIVTIKDIATVAGVSHTTVSRALADSPLITPKQKMRIQKLANKMGYVPNLSARSLVRGRSFTVGLFFSSIGSHITPDFYYQATTILQKTVKDEYNLVIRGVDDYAGDFSKITQSFFEGIMLISQTEDDDPFIQHLVRNAIPFVLVNRKHDLRTVDCFYANEREAISQLVITLSEMGHRRIAFVKGPEGRISTRERFQGFLDAVKGLGLPTEGIVLNGDYTFESGYRAGCVLSAQRPLPDAVVCSNDNMAIGLMRALAEKGIVVPDAISVTGFDGAEMGRYIYPALYTVLRPVETIVLEAAKRLVQKLSSGDCEQPQQMCFGCTVIQAVSYTHL
ncbi:MAG: LacI family transcriptional regulator, partial [Spirochaetes bacterium]|nr:LacI family transcriptional regulator [Spirochaetota bacterium]